ncbi:MAG TPA: penicillin acylase family protein [Bryobacteraceae bacterium]|nr:penicillin acylase family protein [Bryobacteraceae bacterium]
MKRVLWIFALLAPVFAATPAETIQVAGLSQPAEIIKDHWGVSHIYAKNEHDLFFAQGYNVARDRLFQLEMWRRQATGTVAEILGKRELKRDIGNRLFMFRGDLNQELNWYHPHGAAIIGAFVEGINAYIAETERSPALLPIDFKMLGIKPGKWTPAVVISRFNGLLGNIDQELNLALAVRAIGADKVKDIDNFQPADPDLSIDPAIDASLLSRNILELYRAYRTALKFTPDELLPQYRNPQSTAQLDNAMDVCGAGSWPAATSQADTGVDDRKARPGACPSNEGLSAIDLSRRREDIGSNNWVVSGKLTMSGFPLLMNDPHRVQEAPSLRYWVHLVAPGWDVIGGGEPALPGVSIGHNDSGAWGLTIFGTDSEDLYVYDTNPENPNQYKYRGEWESMSALRESIPVKGESPVAVELKYTRHGPVVFEDKVHHKAYAVRAAWREIGGAPYLASLRMDQAQTWQQFRDACSYSRIPAENMVWADRDGNIGYQAVGIAPQRPNWSGLVPVPGDGRYEWDGYLPIKALPHVLNPEKGFYNTSNEYQIPPGWPYKEALHYMWADPYRAQSVAEFLSSGRRFSVADMTQLQNNNLSIPARSLVPLLADLDISNALAQQAAARLLHWNDALDKDSVEAGIYEMWQRRLMANVRAMVVPKEAQAFIGMPPMSRMVSWMEAPDGRFGADPIAGRNAVLVKSLEETVAELSKRFGPEMEKWKLGAYHYARIMSPMSNAVRPDLREKFDVGHFPRGGDSYTITATGGGDNQTSGGSFKIVVDTENWDNSVGLNNPGQSGDIDNAHYHDLYELWSRGKYFPIFYSRGKVESVAEKKLTLTP